MARSNADGRAVLQLRADTCPMCGSNDVAWTTKDDPDYWDFSDGLAWRQGYCNECSTVFEEQYELVRVVVMRDGLSCGME